MIDITHILKNPYKHNNIIKTKYVSNITHVTSNYNLQITHYYKQQICISPVWIIKQQTQSNYNNYIGIIKNGKIFTGLRYILTIFWRGECENNT